MNKRQKEMLQDLIDNKNNQIKKLQQENKQLQEKLDYDLQWAFKYEEQVDNWNKLKKYLHNQIPTDKTVLTKYIKIFEILDKMQEIEGSYNNEN